jgi:hypothetical protein
MVVAQLNIKPKILHRGSKKISIKIQKAKATFKADAIYNMYRQFW